NGFFADAFVGEIFDLRVISTSFDGVTYTINFLAEPGASYKVTQSSTLQGDFIDVNDATLTADSASASISFEPSQGVSKLFFRIERN
nr:hypothetical protein [bacterium]